MGRKVGVLLSYLLMIFEVLSTLLLTPFIIRSLGQAEYGVFKLASAVNTYLLLLDLGVGNAVTRFIAKYRVTKNREQESKFLGVAVVFYLMIAVIALIAGFALTALFPSVFAKGLSGPEIELGQRLLRITILNTAVTLGTTAYNNTVLAYERYAASKGASIVQILLRILLTYTALRLNMGSIGIVTINLLLTVLFRIYIILYVTFRLKLKPRFKRIELSFVKEVFTYSSLILLQMIATHLNSTVDQVLIGSLVTASSTILAVYGVGSQIVQYYQSIGTAFNGVLMPGVVKLVENNGTPKEYLNEMIRVSRIVFMVTGLIWGVFLINGKEFITLWAGHENTDAYYVALILMTAYLFAMSEFIGTQILWAMNEHKEQSILKLGIVIANVILTVILIRWNPLIGASIGTFISLFAGDIVLMNILFKNKMKIKLRDYYSSMFKGLLPSVSVMTAIGFAVRPVLPDGWLWFLVRSAVMVLCYTACILTFGANAYEKGLLQSLFRKAFAVKH